VLVEKVAGLKRTPVEKKVKEKEFEKISVPDKQETKRPEIKTELGKKPGVIEGLGRKFFRRKVI